eukprot:XP_014061294.1 PREDICTED: uncharacterized protein LOC106608106 [Salmo salar]
MAHIHHSFLGLLVTVLFLLTGVSGETPSMFSRVGDDVRLPCNNVVYPNCSSTTWIYNRAGSKVTIEEVALGKIKVDQPERADRLSLESNCSLHVSDVSAEDAGLYTCRQFLTETGLRHGDDTPVHLSVLTRVSLSWVPKTGTNAQVTLDSSCEISLTVTLQKEDNNRKWTCTLTEKGNVKISIDFPSTFSDIEEKTTDNDDVISTVPAKGGGSEVVGDILLSQSAGPSSPRPLLDGTLVWQSQAFSLPALMDSGADESFLARGVVTQLGLDTVPLDSPLDANALNGQLLACSIPEPPDLSSIPLEYHDLAPVFSKLHTLSLPPHRPYDCAIDLQPGAPLPCSRLYNLSHPEQEAMEGYIQDSLAAGHCRPSSSQSLVNDVLRDVIGRFVFVYVDDIQIFSKDPEAHQQHVRQVLQQLLENKLFVKAEKSVWQPFTPLTSTSTPFHWTREEKAAFREHKRRFTSALILTQPHPELQFVVEVDASTQWVHRRQHRFRAREHYAIHLHRCRCLLGDRVPYSPGSA